MERRCALLWSEIESHARGEAPSLGRIQLSGTARLGSRWRRAAVLGARETGAALMVPGAVLGVVRDLQSPVSGVHGRDVSRPLVMGVDPVEVDPGPGEMPADE